MNVSACMLCHEAEVLFEHRLRVEKPLGGATLLWVCDGCHENLVDRDFLALVERLVEAGRPVYGGRKLETPLEQVQAYLELAHSLSARLLDGWRAIE